VPRRPRQGSDRPTVWRCTMPNLRPRPRRCRPSLPHSLAAAVLALAAAAGGGASALANDIDFPTWLRGLRQDALTSGIRPSTLDRALAGVHPIPKVLELDRRQPEKTITFAQYVDRVVNDARIDGARRRLEANRKLLQEIGAKYGVQPRFIVALWGIETDFGSQTGGFPVVSSLATLAYDGRRSDFFRGELINALKIVDQGHVAPSAMTGSWAGAMGQSQFMPSSFLSYAVDWNGDGRRDIWTTRADVFASIANYLSTVGWHADQTWGREVALPPGFDAGSLARLDVRKPLAEWRSLGVRRTDGGELPMRTDLEASIVLPGGPGSSPALLVYDNYRTIMNWNRSLYFASAVGYLADSMEEQ